MPIAAALIAFATAAWGDVVRDQEAQTVTIGSGGLVLRLRHDGRCMLDSVKVNGHEVVAPGTGVCGAVKVGGRWYTTRESIPSPVVTSSRNTVTVTGILFGGGGVQVEESWTFARLRDGVRWRIDRRYLTGGTLDDTYMPGWDFASMSTWTGAILGTGGVAWCKLFDAPNATYGVHTGNATFWNRENDACLSIAAKTIANAALRFSRQPSGVWAIAQYVTESELKPKEGQYRFRRDRQDIWAPFAVAPSEASVEYTLRASNFRQTFDRGDLTGLDGEAVRDILSTIARLGVIDDKIMGSNGWYSGYAVPQEPWFAQMGAAIADPAYTANFARALDYEREHGITADGRVRPRWAYGPWDAIPGTYDENGFYECQWGIMLDSQASYVLNVCEQFDLTGDLEWLKRQALACRKALDYLLKRDSNGNGLVEMMTASEREGKGSDWIDVVWASYENALVNAQLYAALRAWEECEHQINDLDEVLDAWCADRLKEAFNKPISEGGFWDPVNKWYVHWRDKDGSVHGNNLVTPVNFAAIAYGLCDDRERRKAILERMEAEMKKEKLFFWPLCFFPYTPGEAAAFQYPFPNYENGDIFLAWGELGTRAYAAYMPAIALKYVKSVLAQNEKDGLAFQRYLRKTQTGSGDDILANMCSPVVGLYRNLYGIRPKYNRLYLEPHLTPEMSGTRLKYSLRKTTYTVSLAPGDYAVSANGLTVRCGTPFGVSADGLTLQFFPGTRTEPRLTVIRSPKGSIDLRMTSWTAQSKSWSVRAKGPMGQRVSGLTPHQPYRLFRNGRFVRTVEPNADGWLDLNGIGGPFELRP